MCPLINVKVHPKARQNKVQDNGDGNYTVWTSAAPDKGEANAAVAKALADYLGVAKSSVVLKRGGTSRNKVFEIP